MTLVFGSLALGVVFLWCARHAERIEAETHSNASAALRTAGLDFATVQADGQRVTLRGTALDESARSAAVTTVRTAPGVIAVDDRMTIAASAPPPGPDPTPRSGVADGEATGVAVPRGPEARP